ncbi:MAG: nitroreductase [Sphingomonadaceae bacterium]|uniref:nitroreductase n=1 Tax=Thermaurantiacus sp. TaxID=2820283 RepID=UPI00298EFF7A|nr:nitroreductase [Thermaurantiacus sp.]MCS6985846.1 nitroreductase [Sphingomonadaceae bacterium]MDW8413885.1 nitroreductase [Thermaurantiacus sp.]
MRVSEAVAARRSVRGFRPTPVDPAVIRRVLEVAARAPSGGNLQPWYIDVVGGERLEELKAIMRRRLIEAPTGEPTDYDIYPKDLPSPHRDYRFQVGEDLYGALGIPREDKARRLAWFARNFQFFGAPLALFCSTLKVMGPPQWSDLGMFLQTVMLLLKEEGLDSCAQECWSLYPRTVGAFLGLPDDRILFCGMSIGFADPEDPANAWRSRRAPLEAWARFHGL